MGRRRRPARRPQGRPAAPNVHRRLAPGRAGPGAAARRRHYRPKDRDVITQDHSHRAGKVEKARTRPGLYFTKGAAKAIQPLIVPGWIPWIPAGAAQHVVKGSVWLAADCTAYNVTPHMH